MQIFYVSLNTEIIPFHRVLLTFVILRRSVISVNILFSLKILLFVFVEIIAPHRVLLTFVILYKSTISFIINNYHYIITLFIARIYRDYRLME